MIAQELICGNALKREKFKLDIEIAYGSLESPSWSFVQKRIKTGPFGELIKKLSEIASVDETTDLNDDCSRAIFVDFKPYGLTLRLSLVGKYACAHDKSGFFLSESDLLVSALGQELWGLLKADDIELIDAETLKTKIELGGEFHSLYEVLFSADGLIS